MGDLSSDSTTTGPDPPANSVWGVGMKLRTILVLFAFDYMSIMCATYLVPAVREGYSWARINLQLIQ